MVKMVLPYSSYKNGSRLNKSTMINRWGLNSTLPLSLESHGWEHFFLPFTAGSSVESVKRNGKKHTFQSVLIQTLISTHQFPFKKMFL